MLFSKGLFLYGFGLFRFLGFLGCAAFLRLMMDRQEDDQEQDAADCAEHKEPRKRHDEINAEIAAARASK